jgi:hypothetical protein
MQWSLEVLLVMILEILSVVLDAQGSADLGLSFIALIPVI